MSDRDWEAYSKSTYKWEPGHPKHLRMTKSSLTSDFDFCPKQYEYKRVHGLPTPETDAMRKGTNVHNAVEYYYDNVYPYLDDLLTLMQRDKRDEALALALSILPDETYELGEEKSIETRLKWDLERLLAGGKDDYLPIINEAEIHAFTEEEFEFNGEVLTIPIHWAGSIDRGFATENGVALMELKTGKWLQTAKMDKTGTVTWEDQSFKVQSMRTEMAFYKHLLQMADHEHQNVTHWGWVYPSGEVEGLDTYNKYGYEQRSINRIFYEEATGRRWSDYQKKVNRLKDALITAYLTGDFPPKPSQGKCAWCDFKSICPSWEGSDDPKEYIAKMQEEE